jgi:hypothetical protein
LKINELEAGQKQKFVPSNTDENRMFQKFLSDCSESIAAMKETSLFLYRGLTTPPHVIFLGRSRDQRDTRDTSSSIQTSIDEILQKGGLTALRSNSIFSTSVSSDAGFYGTPYMIFPKNGFSFTWSPKIRDFTSYCNQCRVLNSDEIYKFGKDYTVLSDEIENIIKAGRQFKNEVYARLQQNLQTNPEIKSALAKVYYQIGNLFSGNSEINPEFIPSAKLIMSRGVVTNGSPELLNELLKLPDLNNKLNSIKEIHPADIFKGLGYTNQNFAGALKSQYEIMIHGEYYAFQKNRYYPELSRAIL